MIFIGERINAGFKDIRAAIENNDADPIKEWAVKQTKAGATYLDVNMGTASAKPEVLCWMIESVQEVVETPISIDNNKPTMIKEAVPVWARVGKAFQMYLASGIIDADHLARFDIDDLLDSHVVQGNTLGGDGEEITLALLEHAQSRREPKPNTMTACAEEGVEDLPEGVGAHALTLVLHGQRHVRARYRGCVGGDEGLVEHDVVGVYGYAAFAADGLFGVGDQRAYDLVDALRKLQKEFDQAPIPRPAKAQNGTPARSESKGVMDLFAFLDGEMDP